MTKQDTDATRLKAESPMNSWNGVGNDCDGVSIGGCCCWFCCWWLVENDWLEIAVELSVVPGDWLKLINVVFLLLLIALAVEERLELDVELSLMEYIPVLVNDFEETETRRKK